MPVSSRLHRIALVAFISACGAAEEGDGGGDAAAPDAGGPGAADGAPLEVECDEVTKRAILPGPFACDDEPAYVSLQGRRRFDIFVYEASHPLATPTLAFPCAQAQGTAYEAPRARTEACSKAGVRPWHSVRWDDADAACKAIGWRLCTGDELRRACEGPDGNAYTFGGRYEGGRCNFRESYTAPGNTYASESPAGQFAQCVSGEGVFDSNGNLWEWNGDRDEADPRTHYYQGAGWRTIPQRHHDANLVCAELTRIPGFSADSFASSDVGFRCCRATP